MTAAASHRAGADALASLMFEIERIDVDTAAGPDDAVRPDFQAMATLIEASIRDNFALQSDPLHREGWLRSMTYVLFSHAAGFTFHFHEVDVLKETASAFEGRRS